MPLPLDNPLLTQELRPEHVKPRLLGHWGTLDGLVMATRSVDVAAAGDDREITARGARVRTFVVAAREDKQISAEVRSVLRYSD